MFELKVGVAVSVILLAFMGGVRYTEGKYAREEVIRLEEQIEAARRMDRILYDVGVVINESLSEITIENKTIYQQARTELVNVPVYSECIVPVGGINLMNKARGYDDAE